MTHPVSVLRSFQRLLAGIYDVPVEEDIARFVVTERAQLPMEHRHTRTLEQVLVASDGDATSVSVYLDAQLLARLADADPFDALTGDNLADYWTALEGVSHFLYIAWNASHARPVTLFELELQAEIDKYVSSLWLLKRQHPKRFPVELHHLLFERSRIDAALAQERISLYQRADRYAERFCRALARRFASSLASVRRDTLAELRRFYRLDHERKARHIERQPAETA